LKIISPNKGPILRQLLTKSSNLLNKKPDKWQKKASEIPNKRSMRMKN